MLTNRQKKWADLKIASFGTLSNSEAAVQAGYSKTAAENNSWRFAKIPAIIDYINEKTNGQANFILRVGQIVHKKHKSKNSEEPVEESQVKQPARFFDSAEDYAMAVINNEVPADRDKLKAAEILLTAKRLEQNSIGKKEQRDLFAQSLVSGANDSVGGRFAVFKPVGN